MKNLMFLIFGMLTAVSGFLPVRHRVQTVTRTTATTSKLNAARIRISSLPTNPLKKFVGLTTKTKIVVLAHPVVVALLFWLMKSLFSMLTSALGGTHGKPIPKEHAPAFTVPLPVHHQASPLTVNSSAAPAPPKKRVTVATQTASADDAKARVVQILAAMDDATLKAKQKVGTPMGQDNDAEAVARDAYIARIKQADNERLTKLNAAKEEIAAKEAEHKRKLGGQQSEFEFEAHDAKSQSSAESSKLVALANETKRANEAVATRSLQQAQGAKLTANDAKDSLRALRGSEFVWSPHNMAAPHINR
jgi:hypothetical protein